MPEIRSLMTGRRVVTLSQSASVLEAARSMHAENVGALLVTDSQQRPCGIFTERDLMLRVVVEGRDPGGVRLEEVMTRDVYTTHPGCKVAEARLELQQRHIRHLPVVEDGKVVALLSLRDLLGADLEQASSELRETRRYIRGENHGLPGD